MFSFFFLDEDGKVTWGLLGSTLVHARVERSLRWTDWDYRSGSGGGVDGGLSPGWLLYLLESFCLQVVPTDSNNNHALSPS
jgi:hypothetical protein